MKMKKLLLIPFVGMVAAFAMSNFIAEESYESVKLESRLNRRRKRTNIKRVKRIFL